MSIEAETVSSHDHLCEEEGKAGSIHSTHRLILQANDLTAKSPDLGPSVPTW